MGWNIIFHWFKFRLGWQTTKHYSLAPKHYKLHTPHLTLQTKHSTLNSPHYTLHNTHCTLHTTHCPLPTTHYTLHTTHYWRCIECWSWDRWQVTGDRWQVIGDRWHLTHDISFFFSTSSSSFICFSISTHCKISCLPYVGFYYWTFCLIKQMLI